MSDSGQRDSGRAPPAAGAPWVGVRAVLFDLDGTLVQTDIDFAAMRREILAAAERHGASLDGLAELDALGIVGAVLRQVRQPDAFQAEAERALRAIELRAGARARAMPGAAGLLPWLAAAGLRVGIVTRNCRPAAEEALRRAGLVCGLLLTRADVPRVKPDPIHLLLAAERLAAAPGETVMVGDHVMDVRGGRAAGMRTVGFAPTEEAARKLAAAGPELLIRHLDELRPWISPSSW
jgi:phosphoglycolate phosphatase